MKCAVFPCLGLGDGLIALILSHNLASLGYRVDTFHPFLGQLQSLFPTLPILPRPESLKILDQYDRIFFIYEKLEWMQTRIDYAEENFPEKTVILNPIATPNCDYQYWEQGRFDGNTPFGDNLVAYCRSGLKIEHPTKNNGMQLSQEIKKRRNINRVILHPTSSRPGKNWTQPQFIELANRLKREKFDPVFILTEEEKKGWPEEINAPHFEDLNAVTAFVAESGWMIVLFF